jgi:hypothetical protein
MEFHDLAPSMRNAPSVWGRTAPLTEPLGPTLQAEAKVDSVEIADRLGIVPADLPLSERSRWTAWSSTIAWAPTKWRTRRLG